MSENSTPEERTELPTDKRWQKIRSEGQLPLSTETNQLITLIFSFLILVAVSSSIWFATKSIMISCFSSLASKESLSFDFLEKFFFNALIAFLPNIGILIVGTAIFGSILTLVQTGGNIREKWIKLRWDFLNPLTGISRIFSIHGFANLSKALLKLSFLIPVGFYALWSLIPDSVALISLDLESYLELLARGTQKIFWRLVLILVPIAIIDYFYTRYMFFRQNKMTKDEVKDERKSIEGDESTKRRIRAKGLERVWQRIAVAVPKADVIVVNPTHYAVALKYDRGTMVAPTVVAKGKGHLALRIREIARESKVPIVQRRMLSRSLYYSVKVGAQIPFELFRAVAEVLAYVYSIRPKKS